VPCDRLSRPARISVRHPDSRAPCQSHPRLAPGPAEALSQAGGAADTTKDPTPALHSAEPARLLRLSWAHFNAKPGDSPVQRGSARPSSGHAQSWALQQQPSQRPEAEMPSTIEPAMALARLKPSPQARASQQASPMDPPVPPCTACAISNPDIAAGNWHTAIRDSQKQDRCCRRGRLPNGVTRRPPLAGASTKCQEPRTPPGKVARG